ncbi:ATP-dependent Clp protease proteolytic subunit [Ramlibacter sp. XY19]|uniref:ATP-dependent Clp protease proteolytic subunit n=1 Tax=Ramlibacter paludis TaxID=2908000 RepID=UPI0023DB2BE1|nr:ATP-dependent Clp protease proteolytic subunit [Ramlibacter paludis]MCG2595542.1 ATP-dependent Clp protease proteolytic subunit [Ramlibacter paludis]
MTDLPWLDPHIRLFGTLDDDMYAAFREQLNQARKDVAHDQPLLLELTTSGGDAETARRMALDVTLCREREQRRIVFLGKSFVYSAGITVMAAFPVQDRCLTRDTELLIHERRLERTVQLSGALRSNLAVLRAAIAEIESGQRLEREGFRQLVAGSKMSVEHLLAKVLESDWYLCADEAKAEGLVSEVI